MKYFLLWQFYQIVASALMARMCGSAFIAAIQKARQTTQRRENPDDADLNSLPSHLFVVVMLLGFLGSLCAFVLPMFYAPGHVWRVMHNISTVEYKRWKPLWSYAVAAESGLPGWGPDGVPNLERCALPTQNSRCIWHRSFTVSRHAGIHTLMIVQMFAQTLAKYLGRASGCGGYR